MPPGELEKVLWEAKGDKYYQELSETQMREYKANAGKLRGGRLAQDEWSLEIAPFFKDKDRMAHI